MFIQAGFRDLNRNEIKIPAWIRAPIGLVEGAEFYQFGRKLPNIGFEIFFSMYPPSSWPDLWRIELDLLEDRGVGASLVELLDSLKIFILEGESQLFRGVLGHSSSFVCDLSNYASEVDRDFEHRINEDRCEMLGLEALLSERLISALWFDKEGGPRIRINRLKTYRRIYFKMLEEIGDANLPQKDYRNRTLPISKHLMKGMRASLNCKSRELRYFHATDAKDRIIRTVITKNENHVFQVRIFFRRDAWMLGHLLAKIADGGFSILASRIRGNAVIRSHVTCELKKGNYMTLDLIIGYEYPNVDDRESMIRGFLNRLQSEMPQIEIQRRHLAQTVH